MLEQAKIFWHRLNSYGQQRSLNKILNSIDPNANRREQIYVLAELLAWLSKFRKFNANAFDWDFEGVGLRYLCKRLDEQPEIKQKLITSLENLLIDIDPTDFFVEGGLVSTNAFFSELMNCLIAKYMPKFSDVTKLGTVSELLLRSGFEPEWLTELNEDSLQGFWTTIKFSDQATQKIQDNFNRSVETTDLILTSRIVSLSASSLFASRVSREQLETLVSIGKNLDKNILNQSRQVITSVYNSLEHQGVSIELVFLIERIKAILSRLETINLYSTTHHLQFLKLAAIILSQQKTRHSLTQFFDKNLALISKNIVERNTISGEKYIARNQEERNHIFMASAGGGAIIALTTIVKYNLVSANLPLFVEGVGAFVNYTLSFLVIQLAHLILATKTPAMTAASLASKLVDRDITKDREGFLTEVRAVVNSGVLSILGNVLFVSLTALILDTLYFFITGGRHFFTTESAEKYILNHNPIYSLSLWFAAYTGVVLWLGSAIGGWFENWFVFRGLPEAIKENRWLRAMVGGDRAFEISTWVTKNVLGFATTVALGFFLAFTTVFGEFLGVPLDVRHVTLSAGTVALSAAALNDLAANWGLIASAVLGVAFIGVFNFGISLLVSFLVAGQARALNFDQIRSLIQDSVATALQAIRRLVGR